MKKFIINATIFFILIFSFAFVLDKAISAGLRRMGDYRFMSWNESIYNSINADLIINGNSRGLSHFNPKYLDSILKCNSYNLGIGGYPFSMQMLKYNLFSKYNKLPKVIVQNVDFITLEKADFFGHEREQVFPFVFNPYLQKELYKLGFNKVELFFPLVRYFGYQFVIKNGLLQYFHLKNYTDRPSTKGFYPEKGTWSSQELDKITKIEFRANKQTKLLFELYLKKCAEEKIKVILVNSPVYYQASNKLINRVEMNKYYNEIAQKFGHIYLDYTSDSMCYDTSNFVVAVHLNETGANKFSVKLATHLDSIKIFAKD